MGLIIAPKLTFAMCTKWYPDHCFKNFKMNLYHDEPAKNMEYDTRKQNLVDYFKEHDPPYILFFLLSYSKIFPIASLLSFHSQ